MVAMSFYLYGDAATELAAREKPLWQAWLARPIPAPG